MSGDLNDALCDISEAVSQRLVEKAKQAVEVMLRQGLTGKFTEEQFALFVRAGAQQSLMEAYCLACAEGMRNLSDADLERQIYEKVTLFAAGMKVFARTGPDGAVLQ